MLNPNDLVLDHSVLLREHLRCGLSHSLINFLINQKNRQPHLIHQILQRLTVPRQTPAPKITPYPRLQIIINDLKKPIRHDQLQTTQKGWGLV